MKVSVIIPTYNRAHLVARSVRSVLNQTYPDIQIIVVDDGSTDDTEKALREFIDAKQILYLPKGNSGAADSRNYGVSHASGTIITFLDSDDEGTPEWISKLVQLFKVDVNCQIVFCGCSTYDENGRLLYSKFPTKKGPLFQGLVCRFTNSGIFALRKDFFDSLGGYDAKLPSSQHTELGIRAAQALKDGERSTAWLNESLVKIHIHTGPRIRTNSSAKAEGVRMLYDKHKRLILLDKKNRVDYLKILTLNSIKSRDLVDSVSFGFLYGYYKYIAG